MTKKEYKEYEDRVADFFKREEIEILHGEGEGFMSHYGCDCCGNGQYQTLYNASGSNPGIPYDGFHEYQICGDCLYYAEYGQLDDMTMMDMKD